MSNDYQAHEPDRRRNVELEKVLARVGWGVSKHSALFVTCG
jgi:hypothetical protein